ncbi:glycosyltransferase family 2 protein [uncultured Varibaculum sp.]|uniref:glycosyltransferase family 2 protein n=1 Tax=uncultured Varibaculum sp. TaxID=413896 RepID=UPI00259955CC|nr:glycosyltransferase family 2 protein [uncultured Varibaculum sp.]
MKTFESLSNPLISVGIVALNEEDYLPDMLSCIKAQDYPHHLIQVVLVDSGSEDATPRIMKDFATRATDFESATILPNPGKTAPRGWNVFLNAASGEIMVRLDAHARIPNNFLSQIVAVLAEGEAVAGGPRPTITPKNATAWQQVLHTVEESMFGASIAKYRGNSKSDSNAPQYVKSVFHPGYRRSVIDAVGPFNEKLTRTEDNDYSYRIRKAGYKIRFDSRIYSEQIIRPSLLAMIRQKYNNGYWIGRTLFIQPGCIEVYHLVPGAFVFAIAAGIALRLRGIKLPLRLLAASYGTADLVLSAASLPKVNPPTSKAASLPLIFPALHIAYGIGTWKGILEGLKETFQGGRG